MILTLISLSLQTSTKIDIGPVKPNSWTHALRWSPDGKHLIYNVDGTLHFWPSKKTLKTKGLLGVQWSPDGKYLRIDGVPNPAIVEWPSLKTVKTFPQLTSAIWRSKGELCWAVPMRHTVPPPQVLNVGGKLVKVPPRYEVQGSNWDGTKLVVQYYPDPADLIRVGIVDSDGRGTFGKVNWLVDGVGYEGIFSAGVEARTDLKGTLVTFGDNNVWTYWQGKGGVKPLPPIDQSTYQRAYARDSRFLTQSKLFEPAGDPYRESICNAHFVGDEVFVFGRFVIRYYVGESDEVSRDWEEIGLYRPDTGRYRVVRRFWEGAPEDADLSKTRLASIYRRNDRFELVIESKPK